MKAHCLGHVVFYVKDLERSIEFYRDLLGFKEVGKIFNVSQNHYLRDPDGNEVELYVDADESVWKNNPAAVLSPIKPLCL